MRPCCDVFASCSCCTRNGAKRKRTSWGSSARLKSLLGLGKRRPSARKRAPSGRWSASGSNCRLSASSSITSRRRSRSWSPGWRTWTVCANSFPWTSTSDNNEPKQQNIFLFLFCRLAKLNKGLEGSLEDAAKCRALFDAAVEEVNRRIDKEKQETLQQTLASSAAAEKKKGSGNWTPEELNLLIKAVNLFPAGTNQRWEVVANFVNQHHGGNRTAKEVLAQAKDLQQSDFSRSSLKEAANKAAYNKFEKDQTKAGANGESIPSERYESKCHSHPFLFCLCLYPSSTWASLILSRTAPAEQMGINLTPWTADEQRLLEQSLKTYPASVPDRWDRIAEAIPNRSKKDCMKRYKVVTRSAALSIASRYPSSNGNLIFSFYFQKGIGRIGARQEERPGSRVS